VTKMVSGIVLSASYRGNSVTSVNFSVVLKRPTPHHPPPPPPRHPGKPI
jgi:hypothetical protein